MLCTCQSHSDEQEAILPLQWRSPDNKWFSSNHVPNMSYGLLRNLRRNVNKAKKNTDSDKIYPHLIIIITSNLYKWKLSLSPLPSYSQKHRLELWRVGSSSLLQHFEPAVVDVLNAIRSGVNRVRGRMIWISMVNRHFLGPPGK